MVKDAKGNTLIVGDRVKYTSKNSSYQGRYNHKDIYEVTEVYPENNRISTRCISNDFANGWMSEYFTKIVATKNHFPGWW